MAASESSLKNRFSWWFQEFFLYNGTKSVLTKVRNEQLGLEPLAPLCFLVEFLQAGNVSIYIGSGNMPFLGPEKVFSEIFEDGPRYYGRGPEPMQIKNVTADNLSQRIKEALKPEYAVAASEFASKMLKNPVLKLLHVKPSTNSVFTRRTGFVTCSEGKVDPAQLEPLELGKISDLVSPGDPIGGFFYGIGQVAGNIQRDLRTLPHRQSDTQTTTTEGDKSVGF
ncbi:uncharacterized protein BCR38DRAFT_409230 [Pseudomassariella vexata]|uniref:Uncharacterized protein n=1 Tax=Pseudomassariella vexata TaxID=1141098 RepID=A0A1Y2E1W8_9PEZI|nr:uncharacterized protein BCR38DRAFT_409230 [Pseudomassariella vexata]ORY65543.1 hypothetical protein BCR38DRAFT_409230 [Pseudomassariella vexata]